MGFALEWSVLALLVLLLLGLDLLFFFGLGLLFVVDLVGCVVFVLVCVDAFALEGLGVLLFVVLLVFVLSCSASLLANVSLDAGLPRPRFFGDSGRLIFAMRGDTNPRKRAVYRS